MYFCVGWILGLTYEEKKGKEEREKRWEV